MHLRCNTMRSESGSLSQTSSHVVVAITRYSASPEERETTVYFFVHQEKRLVLSVMKKPVVERRVVGQLTQLKSEYAESCKSQVDGKNSPWLGELFR